MPYYLAHALAWMVMGSFVTLGMGYVWLAYVCSLFHEPDAHEDTREDEEVVESRVLARWALQEDERRARSLERKAAFSRAIDPDRARWISHQAAADALIRECGGIVEQAP